MHFYLLLTLLFCAQIVPPSLKGVPAKGMQLKAESADAAEGLSLPSRFGGIWPRRGNNEVILSDTASLSIFPKTWSRPPSVRISPYL